PTARNATMAATLVRANQNSASPNCRTPIRLMPPRTATTTPATTHCGTPGHQPETFSATPVTSTPSTMISMNQYSQPSRNPAHRPSATSAYTENEPEAGSADAISASIRMTATTIAPAM